MLGDLNCHRCTVWQQILLATDSEQETDFVERKLLESMHMILAVLILALHRAAFAMEHKVLSGTLHLSYVASATHNSILFDWDDLLLI